VLILFSCRKEEIIPGNKSIPDASIEDATISSYITHAHISVLGRKATTEEQAWAFTLLRSSNMAVTTREQFLDSIFSKEEYLLNLFTLARVDLLQNLDTGLIKDRIAINTYLLSQPEYKLVYDYLRADNANLDSLRRIPEDLKNKKLDIIYMHRRCVFNSLYDDINMGTENFVVSCFQHFLSRYPTAYELEQSKNMVNGVPAILFLQSGQTKSEFISIFFSSSDYYEGLVRNLYNRLLFRTPTSIEMGQATLKFQQDMDYIQMQKDILITNEFAGIK
jgi:hypothetical protein